MYLAPWQIFAGGCVVGALITFITIFAIILKIMNIGGVQVKQADKEQNENGRE